MKDYLKNLIIKLVINYAWKYIKARLSESSTIRNIVLFIGGLISISYGANSEGFISYVLIFVGFLGTVLPDIIAGITHTEPDNSSSEIEAVIGNINSNSPDVPFSSGFGDK